MTWISDHNTTLKALLEEGRPSLPRHEGLRVGADFHKLSKGTRQRVKRKIKEHELCNEVLAELEALMSGGVASDVELE